MKSMKNKNSQTFWVKLEMRLILKRMNNLKWKKIYIAGSVITDITHI